MSLAESEGGGLRKSVVRAACRKCRSVVGLVAGRFDFGRLAQQDDGDAPVARRPGLLRDEVLLVGAADDRGDALGRQPGAQQGAAASSAERRVGQECFCPCVSWCTALLEKTTQK